MACSRACSGRSVGKRAAGADKDLVTSPCQKSPAERRDMRREAEAKRQSAWHLARDIAGEPPPTPKTPAAKRKAEKAPTPAQKRQATDAEEKEKERRRDLHEAEE